jgi:hypothetical protein
MPTTEGRIDRQSIGRGRRRKRWVGRIILPVIMVLVAGGGFFAFTTFKANLGEPSCRATALGQSVTFTPEQSANAATITALALKRGLPARAATIANATAIVESKLVNLKFGDLDSLGLFQQRPSQGWGTPAQILDPIHATNAFYDALIKINGYQSMAITQVAQEVQHSGFPQAYADHEQEGRILASTLSGHSPGGIGCRLDAATVATPATTIAAQLTTELGVPTGSDTQQAWAVGSWAVAHADAYGITSVTVGDRTWTRARGEDAWSWQAATNPLAPTAVTITRL